MKIRKIFLSSLGAALLVGGGLLCAPILAQQGSHSILTEQELISNFPGLPVEELEGVANKMRSIGNAYDDLKTRRHDFTGRTVTVGSASHDVTVSVGQNYGGRWVGDDFVVDLVQRVHAIKRSPGEGWTKKTSLIYYEHFTEATGTRQLLDASMWLEYPGYFPENAALKRTTSGPFMTMKASRGGFQTYISRGFFQDSDNFGYYIYYIRFTGGNRDPRQYFYAKSKTNIFAFLEDKVELILPFRHTQKASHLIWKIKLLYNTAKGRITFRHVPLSTLTTEEAEEARQAEESRQQQAEEDSPPS